MLAMGKRGGLHIVPAHVHHRMPGLLRVLQMAVSRVQSSLDPFCQSLWFSFRYPFPSTRVLTIPALKARALFAVEVPWAKPSNFKSGFENTLTRGATMQSDW